MYKTVRAEGLQLEAVLNMGNCVYSVLLGTVSALIVYLFTKDGIWTEIQSDSPFRFVSLLWLLPLVAYYMIDWHDLNRASYFDKKIGMGQMCRWILCIILVGMLCVLAVCGKLSAMIAVSTSYIPFSLLLRNRELGLDKKGQTILDAFNQGRVYERLSILKWVLASAIAVGGLVFAVRYHAQMSSDTSLRTVTAVCLTLAWLAMLVEKFSRSRSTINRRYKEVIGQMLAEQEGFLALIRGGRQGQSGGTP